MTYSPSHTYVNDEVLTHTQLIASLSEVAAYTDSLRPYFNVKSYGATGNGATNDLPAIAAAITAATAAGGGTVYLPTGTYRVTGTIVLPDDVRLLGDGFGATIIQLANTTNLDVVQTTGFGSNTGGASLNGPQRFALEALTIDGNRTNNTSGWCARLYGANYRVAGCEFINGTSGGVWSEWGTGGSNAMEAHWHDWKIYNCGGTALDWNGPHDSVLSSGNVFSIGSGNPTLDYAIRVHGNATAEYFTNVHTWGKQTVGWRLESPTYAIGCVAEGAYDCNVWFVGNNSEWIGGQVYGTNNQPSNAGEVGFRFGDLAFNGANTCSVADTYMSGFTGTGRPLDYVKSWGANRVRINLRAGGSMLAAYKGTPSGLDVVDILCADQTAMSLKVDSRPFGAWPVLANNTYAVASGNFSSASLTPPVNTVTGDVVVYVVAAWGGSVTAPGGVTEIGTGYTNTGASFTTHLYWWRSDGTTTAKVFTIAGSSWMEAGAINYKTLIASGNPVDAVAAAHNTTNATSISFPTATATTGSTEVALIGILDLDGQNYTPPAGYTEELDAAPYGVYIADKAVTGAGAVAATTAANTVSNSLKSSGLTLLLKAA